MRVFPRPLAAADLAGFVVAPLAGCAPPGLRRVAARTAAAACALCVACAFARFTVGSCRCGRLSRPKGRRLASLR
eukprot:8769864-Alexandrium_andersonii.AAC.1